MISVGLGLLLSAGIGAGATLLGGWWNRSESRDARAEAKQINDRDFEYQQELDRFQMGVTNRQLAQTDTKLAEDRRMNSYTIVQNQVNQINEMLKSNVGLRDNLRSLYGGRR